MHGADSEWSCGIPALCTAAGHWIARLRQLLYCGCCRNHHAADGAPNTGSPRPSNQFSEKVQGLPRLAIKLFQFIPPHLSSAPNNRSPSSSGTCAAKNAVSRPRLVLPVMYLLDAQSGSRDRVDTGACSLCGHSASARTQHGQRAARTRHAAFVLLGNAPRPQQAQRIAQTQSAHCSGQSTQRTTAGLRASAQIRGSMLPWPASAAACAAAPPLAPLLQQRPRGEWSGGALVVVSAQAGLKQQAGSPDNKGGVGVSVQDMHTHMAGWRHARQHSFGCTALQQSPAVPALPPPSTMGA